MRRLELLAPARDLRTGIIAIDSGADAVYIGGPRFGARAAAGNTIDDIGQLCSYAHSFSAKVYATVNTLFHAEEMDEAVGQIHDLYHVGIDAVLIQDARLLYMPLPPVSIHASTQMDNRSLEHCMNLYRCGIRRVVLAREMSLEQIKHLHESLPGDMELEVFVHGALCVSYSGRCHASQYCFKRSADRGECAQVCRMKFALLGSDGRRIGPDAHYLSLKDMCRLQHLDRLVEAGVTSFKIEGRLKDEAYVRNVVAAYHEKLKQITEQYPDKYTRVAVGRVENSFRADVKKTFNRGYTGYFLTDESSASAWSPLTPKAVGEYVGCVETVASRFLTVNADAGVGFSNGDGLCFFSPTSDGSAVPTGLRINRVDGKRLIPLRMPAGLKPGMRVYRNHDEAFIQQLNRHEGRRKVDIRVAIAAVSGGYRLTAMAADAVEDGVSVVYPFQHQQAERPQEDNIRRQLTKWGDTPYRCNGVELDSSVSRHFIPTGVLNAMRRQLAQALAAQSERDTSQTERHTIESEALQQLRDRQKENISDTNPLMQCRFCLKQALGLCTKYPLNDKPPITIYSKNVPKFLQLDNGMTFRLEFDCTRCQTNIYAHN